MGLMRAVLKSSNLERAILRDADLSRVDLEFASLKNADLTNASLQGAALGGATLTASRSMAPISMERTSPQQGWLRRSGSMPPSILTRRRTSIGSCASELLLTWAYSPCRFWCFP